MSVQNSDIEMSCKGQFVAHGDSYSVLFRRLVQVLSETGSDVSEFKGMDHLMQILADEHTSDMKLSGMSMKPVKFILCISTTIGIGYALALCIDGSD